MEGFDQKNSYAFGFGSGSGSGSGSSLGGATPKPSIRLPNNQMGFSENHKPSSGGGGGSSSGIPPSHPKTNNSPSSAYPQFIPSPQSHSRSLSQPTFFSMDSFSLPPLSPSSYPVASSFSDSGSKDVAMEESLALAASRAPSPNRGPALQHGHCLPPRKGHRRSSSDSPLGISDFVNSVPQKGIDDSRGSGSRGEKSGFEKPIQLVLKDNVQFVDGFKGGPVDGRKEDDAIAMDDLFSAYLNLDSMSFSGMEDKDMDSRNSGSKTVESSDNEVESHVNGKAIGAKGSTSSCSEERKEGVKRSLDGGIAPGARHRRSFSLDSSIGNFHIEDGSPSPKLPPLQNRFRQHSPSNSIDGSKSSEISMEFVNGEFSSEEIKKIMESDKLAEIAMADPKRAKRILANRLSAARSKERKTRYISELEHKVQTLQTETTTLSTQFTKLQMDHAELKNENNEYKLRLQSLEQQSQLKDALNETLDAEVRRLRRIVEELGGESILSNLMAQRIAMNQQSFQLQHQQQNQPRHFQPQNSHSQGEAQTQPQQIQRNHEFQSQRHNGKTTAH